MRELQLLELVEVNGGGLTFSEACLYTAALCVAGPWMPLAVAAIVITEYQDYQDGI